MGLSSFVEEGVLKPAGTVLVLPVTKSFLYKGKKSLPKELYLVDDKFSEWFVGAMDGEACRLITTIKYFDLMATVPDQSIFGQIKKFSDGLCEEVGLRQIFFIFEKQRALLSRANANIFYVKDVFGMRRAVYLQYCHDDEHWVIRADPAIDFCKIEEKIYYYPWESGCRVFCACTRC